LIVNGAVTGSLNLVHPTPGYYTRHHSALAGAFANHAAIAIENARLYARAQEAAAMEERQRLARDLHDSVAQSLYGLSLSADAATRLIASGDLAAAVDSLRDVRESAQAAQKEMRMLIVDLRPPDLARDGLVAALRARVSALEERLANLITSFEADPDLDLRLGSGVEHALYRIAQEALTNVVKHATARAVAVSLRRIDNVTVLEIADDGAGFDQDQPGCQTGFGLRGMAERAAEIGARLDVRSRPGKGTTVRVHLEQ